MRSSLTSFVTLSRSLNLSGLLSLQAWPSAARLTGESIEGAGLDDGARRNTGLPSSVRCSCLEDAGSASPMPPWWGRCVLCKGDVVWWFLTQHRWGPGEQGFLLSVSSTVMGLWCIWVCWGLWLLMLKTHWCVNLMFRLPSFSCVSKHWKDPQGKRWVPQDIYKEGGLCSRSLLSA